ncbi:MAG TPA: hypothetical protein VGQ57_12290, partial [Polyangiaceae bacterium]|nr:hypothetical protein [Polyangiaceae bacterium]
WTLVLFLVTLAPLFEKHIHLGYFAIAVPAGLAFGGLVAVGPRGLSLVHWARRVFFASMPYLVVVYAAFVAAA